MSDQVEIAMSADPADAERAYANLEAKVDALKNKMDGAGRAGQQAGRSTGDAFGKADGMVMGFAGRLAGLVSAWGLVQAGIAGANAELEKHGRLQEAARQRGLSNEESFREVKANFVPDQTVNEKNLDAKLQAIAEATQTPRNEVNIIAASALSAGAETNQAALDAVQQALRLKPGKGAAEAGIVNAGVGIDLMNIVGAKDPRIGLGFLAQIGSATKIANPVKLGSTASPVVNTAVAQGDTAEQGAEIFGLFNRLMRDATGEKSSTAAINFMSAVKSFVPQAQGKDERGRFSVPKEQIDAFNKAADTFARVAELQQSPELRRQFEAKTSFDSSSRAVVSQIISGAQIARDTLADVQKIIQAPNEGQIPLFEQRVKFLEAGPGAVQAQTERGIESVIEGAESPTIVQRAGTARAAVQAAIDKSDLPGFDYFSQSIPKYAFEGQLQANPAEPEEAAIGALKGIKTRMENSLLGARPDDITRIDALIKQMEAANAKYDKMLAAAEENNRLVAEGNAAAKKTADNTGKPAGSPRPLSDPGRSVPVPAAAQDRRNR